MLKKIINSSLFKASGIYTITSLINAAIPFLLIPLLTRALTLSDYGILSMVVILINIVTPFIGISSHGAIHRKYFEEGNQNNISRYVGNSFILLLISSLFFLLLFFLFGKIISDFTAVPKNWLYAILSISICQFITLILLTIWQVRIHSLKYGVLQICQSLINVFLSLYFLYELHLGWQSRVFGQLVAVSIVAIFSLIILIRFKYVKFEYNKTDLRDILQFSIPLIPHTLGGLIITFTDRILITNMVGVNDTGVYTVAFQIGSVLGLINSSFNSAYIPWLYAKLNLKDKQINIKIIKFTYLYFFGLILFAFCAIFMLPSILNILLGKAFQTATVYTVWIVFGYVFNGMYLMVVGFIFYVKKTNILSIVTFSTATLNIPVCYLFLRCFGTIGASISMTIVYFISFIATWILSNKVYKMPWFYFLKAKDI